MDLAHAVSVVSVAREVLFRLFPVTDMIHLQHNAAARLGGGIVFAFMDLLQRNPSEQLTFPMPCAIMYWLKYKVREAFFYEAIQNT